MYIFDFEVFMFDWLVIFKDVTTKEYITIINDSQKLKDFYEKNNNKIFFGYNNKSFDNVIFNAILSDVEPYSTMVMLFRDVPVYQVYKSLKIKHHKLNTLDLMQDILGMSLKEAEGYMGMSVEESKIDFNIDTPLTQEQIDETILYCRHDVDATEKLLEHRQAYVKSKMNLCTMFRLSLDCLDKTNASLSATILSAQKKDYDDELWYDLPKEVIINNPNYKKCLDLYVGRELNYKDKLKIDIAGVPHILAYGGLHGSLDNFEYRGEMWQIDAASYYPTLMLEYNYISRNVKDNTKYKEVYDTRLALKKVDKGKSDALKLVLNTCYGAMKSKYNHLYDPKMANQVCITGQLLFVDLIEKIEPYCKLVQSNTDGILIIPYDKERIKIIIDEWQKRTRVTLEIDPCSGIWQKDVNNYVMTFDSGDIKAVGSYVTDIKPDRVNPVKHMGKARVVALALVDYFTKNIPVEDTINNETNLFNFQIVTKTGTTYNKTYWRHKEGDVLVNKVNRVYATKHQGYGNLYKTKQNPDGTIRKDSIANLPEHCYVDNEGKMQIDYVDRDWYISIAKKRIADFKEKM